MWIDMNILLFDGVCHFCQNSVQFVLKHDKSRSVHFASLQSKLGQSLLIEYGISKDIDSLVFIEDKSFSIKSQAILRLLTYFGWHWRFLLVGRLIPLRVRDQIYDFIARHRYNWFGKDSACMIPSKDMRQRFLD